MKNVLWSSAVCPLHQNFYPVVQPEPLTEKENHMIFLKGRDSPLRNLLRDELLSLAWRDPLSLCGSNRVDSLTPFHQQQVGLKPCFLNAPCSSARKITVNMHDQPPKLDESRSHSYNVNSIPSYSTPAFTNTKQSLHWTKPAQPALLPEVLQNAS